MIIKVSWSGCQPWFKLLMDRRVAGESDRDRALAAIEHAAIRHLEFCEVGQASAGGVEYAGQGWLCPCGQRLVTKGVEPRR